MGRRPQDGGVQQSGRSQVGGIFRAPRDFVDAVQTPWRFADYLEYADWIQTYIFPGSELSAVGEILKSLTRTTRLELHHAEEIGQHYARTIACWRERFLAALPEVRALGFDDRFIRMWEYYLAICEASFLERNTGNVQLVLAKAGTRRQLWCDPAIPAAPLPSELEQPETARR